VRKQPGAVYCLCISALVSGIGVQAQAIPPYDPPKIYTPTKLAVFTARAGLWRTDHSFESTIRLSNQLAISPIDANVTLFMADGTPYLLPPVHLERSGVATVSINSALANAPTALLPHMSDYGSASVSYRYDWQGAVYSSLSMLDVPRSLQYSAPFVFPMASGQARSAPATVMHGLVWSYSETSTYFVSFANSSQRAIKVSLATISQSGYTKNKEVFVIPPKQTLLKTKTAAEDGITAGAVGGVEIVFDGASDALDIAGGIEDAEHGYSANLPLAMAASDAAQTVASQTLASTGIMVGKPDPMMGFPPDLRFRPYAYFRNISSTPLRVLPQIYLGGSDRAPRPLPDMVVLPHQSVELKFPSEVANWNGGITLAYSYQGPANSLLAATGAVDQSGSYVFAVEPRVTGQSVSKSSVFWSTAGAFDTMYSIWNPTQGSQEITMRI
jgi:hypothetical protein